MGVSGRQVELSPASSPLAFQADFPLGWPRLFVVFGEGSSWWVEANQVFEFRPVADSGFEVVPVNTGVAGMDRWVAATVTAEGHGILLDSAGRGVVMLPAGQIVRKFAVELAGTPLAMAPMKGGIAVLEHGESGGGPAVEFFGLDGTRLGAAGEVTREAATQPYLTGGGIASCADQVYYSYLHSPRIWRIPSVPAASVPAASVSGPGARRLNVGGAGFRVPSPQDLEAAEAEVRASASVGPLVQLALASDRVMALVCTGENLLVRQVARHGEGAVIEVIDPRAQEVLGVLPVGSDVLLGAGGRSLLFAARDATGQALLHRRQLTVDG